MAQSMEEFIAELRDSLASWRQDAARFEAQGATALVIQLKQWIIEAEEVIAIHEGRDK
jgi:hypothetical protein